MAFKSLLIVLVLTQAGLSWGMVKGFNQAWFKKSFAYQWLDKYFDPSYVEKIVILNKEANSQLVRMWLYEGSGLRQFDYDPKSNQLMLKPEVLKNLRAFLLIARKHGIKVNLTFLDGNAYKVIGKNNELAAFWWNVFNDQYGALNHFYESAVAPVYKLVNEEFKDVVTQIDLVNEVNALEAFHMFANPNVSMPTFLCRLSKGSPVPVTASLGWHDATERLLDGYLSNACLNFYDIHLYNDEGVIPRCQDFKRLSRKGMKFQLGEFGQQSPAYDDALQSLVTRKFLQNAQNCGFKAALAWRLDDTREGYNPEARHSYMSFGKTRPAYEVFKNFPK